MIAVTDEGIALGDHNEEPFWVAGMKNWRSFAAVLGSDNGAAAALLPEAMDVLSQHDEHYFMTWTLWLQALIANQEDRFEDAIALLRHQVARAQEVDYLRGMMVGLEAWERRMPRPTNSKPPKGPSSRASPPPNRWAWCATCSA
jgi:hypothetical protein